MAMIRRSFSTSLKSCDVVIVGAGVAGTAMACALKSHPAMSASRIVLIDPAQEPSFVPPTDRYLNRMSSLTPASVRFLQRSGVWQNIDTRRVWEYRDIKVLDADGNARLDFSHSDGQGSQHHCLASMVENLNLVNGLTKSAKAMDVELRFNTRVSKMTTGNKEEWVKLDLDSGETLETRLVVGADGANSFIRQSAGIQTTGWSYNQRGVVATLKLASETHLNTTAYQRFLPSGPIAFLPIAEEFASLVWSTTPENAQALCSAPPDLFCSLVNAAFQLSPADISYLVSCLSSNPSSIQEEIEWRQSIEPALLPDIPKIVQVQDDSRASFPLRLQKATHYIEPRLAIVGDAAHVTHPLAGQGLNMGLADVEVLSEVITSATENGLDIGDLNVLRDYNRRRVPANLAMLSAVDGLERVFGFEWYPLKQLRAFGMNTINSIPWLKRGFVHYATGQL